MGFIIEGKKIHVEARKESFYISKNKLKHELLDIIELGYDEMEEAEKLIKEVKKTIRYLEWKNERL